MRTYKILLFVVAFGIICAFISCGKSNGNQNNGETTITSENTNKPLNISIFLDLSDRLTRNLQPSQMNRDTAIIGYILDYFKAQTLGPKILKSKNNIKVFFYPTPQSAKIATLANDLCVDIAQLNGKDKRIALEEMKNKFQKSLTLIYNETLKANNWIGCDIWDFFSSKKVDVQCMRKDARNILFILTDGYLYDENHKIKDGNAYSYILPQTLQNPASSLIVKRDGLENLEVCILEVNPYDIKHRDQMITILENWLQAMGVKKENMNVGETDLPINTQTIIRSFLEK